MSAETEDPLLAYGRAVFWGGSAELPNDGRDPFLVYAERHLEMMRQHTRARQQLLEPNVSKPQPGQPLTRFELETIRDIEAARARRAEEPKPESRGVYR